MGLFTKDDTKATVAAPGGAIALSQTVESVLGKSVNSLTQHLGKLEEGKTILFQTGKSWSAHQLLTYCLLFCGEADVWITSWALGPEPSRSLQKLVEEGRIKHLHCLFDHKIKERSSKWCTFLEGFAKTSYTECHAKAVAIVGAKMSVAIVGSGNFSVNERIEAGAIICSREAADFTKNWIEEAWN